MSLISCAECGKEYTDKIPACPHCGLPFEAMEPGDVAPQQIDNTDEVSAPRISKKNIIAASIFLAVVVMLGIVLGSGLHGDDKSAFNMIVKAAEEFKDPSSVRLVSGTVSESGTKMECALSAENSFGARGTSYYRISVIGGSVFVYKTEYPNGDHWDTSSLNIAKINKELAKALSYD